MPETPPTTSKSKPTLQLIWQDWIPYVEDSDLTDDQKREMIETLWFIVMAFVDLDWELTAPPEETSGKILDLKAVLEAAVLNSEQHTEEAL